MGPRVPSPEVPVLHGAVRRKGARPAPTSDDGVDAGKDAAARVDARAAAVARLLSAANGLAETIAATEQLAQRRAEIVGPRVARGPEPGGRKGHAIISLAEAARRSGRHPEVLRRWCLEGKIAAVRVGRTWAVTPETLATLMQHSARSRPRLPTPGSA